jgi:hypothetical protein
MNIYVKQNVSTLAGKSPRMARHQRQRFLIFGGFSGETLRFGTLGFR